MPQQPAADYLAAQAVPENPESEPMLIPVGEIPVQILLGLRVVPDAAEHGHGTRVLMHAGDLVAMAGGQSFGGEPGGGEGVEHQRGSSSSGVQRRIDAVVDRGSQSVRCQA